MQELAKQFINTMQKLLNLLAEKSGFIMSSNDCSVLEIANARANDTMFVDENGFGFIWFPYNYLPSQHQINDKVKFSLNKDKDAFDAKVITVHFYEGKVKYDIELPTEENGKTRIYNVNSCYVIPF